GGGLALKEATVVAAFNDKDPRFQILSIRLAKDHLGFGPGHMAVTALMGVEALNPSVLREGLVALRDVDAEGAKPSLYELMERYGGKGPPLPRVHRHRRRHRPEAPRSPPRRLPQALHDVRRQGRRAGVRAAPAGHGGIAEQAADGRESARGRAGGDRRRAGRL